MIHNVQVTQAGGQRRLLAIQRKSVLTCACVLPKMFSAEMCTLIRPRVLAPAHHYFEVMMVTGDHALTAEAIARSVGIVTGVCARDVAAADGVDVRAVKLTDSRVTSAVVTGAEIASFASTAEWDAVLSKREVVFARTSPHQKLEIVEHLQRRGEVVAVTGDGVNDAPALKRADIGVAMGSEHASDVAREAADIIILDDNFASIVNGIEEGRTLFDNLKKTIAYTLAHLWPELVPVFLNLVLSFPLALNGMMILAIDLLTEQAPAISLAFEPAEDSIMRRQPRNLRTNRLVSVASLLYSYVVAGVATSLTCLLSYCMVFLRHGILISQVAFSRQKGFFAPPPFLPVGSADRFVAGMSDVGDSALEPGQVVLMPPSPFSAGDRVTEAPLMLRVRVSGGGASSGSGEFNPAIREFDPEEQYAIAREASSAWFLTLVLCQFWHVWNCRTRVDSLFTRGVLSNVVTVRGS